MDNCLLCFGFQKGEIIVVWAFHATQDSLTYHGRSNRGFATITMINSSEASKLIKSLYWKLAVVLFSMAAALCSN